MKSSPLNRRKSSFTTPVPSPNHKDHLDAGKIDGEDEGDSDSDVIIPGFHTVDALKEEIDRMQKDKITSIEEIEHHKKRASYSIVLVLFSVCFAVGMIACSLK